MAVASAVAGIAYKYKDSGLDGYIRPVLFEVALRMPAPLHNFLNSIGIRTPPLPSPPVFLDWEERLQRVFTNNAAHASDSSLPVSITRTNQQYVSIGFDCNKLLTNTIFDFTILRTWLSSK